MPTSILTMSPTVPSAPFIPVKLASTTTPLSPQPTTNSAKSPSPPSPPAQPHQNTAATLRPLYARAARAFLHRDIVLTHSLLSSAFALISPPLTPAPDSLTEYRRKWDVLRITLDVTVYTAPPADTASIPAALRSNALLSAAALLASLHTRSLRLFAPADGPAPNPAFLPPQVLVTLALSSAKIGCPAAGRGIIEEWLACRTPDTAASATPATAEDGYEKVLEVYLLSILPALGDWAYAKQFLGYETELPVQSRERLATSLASLHEQHLTSLVREPAAPSAPPTPKPASTSPPVIHRSSSGSSSRTDSSSAMTTPTPSRPSSPTPSSSSASTNSTHTAVPANPHPRTSRSKQPPANGHSNVYALSPLTSTPSSATATPPTTHDTLPLLRATSRAQRRGDAGAANNAGSPVSRSGTPTTAERGRASSWHVLTRSSAESSLIESMHAALRPYIRYAPLFLLCFVLPALAMLLRSLRRRSKAISGSSAVAAAASVASVVAGAGAAAGMNDAARRRAVEDVRRRLSGARRGVLGTLWDETVRAIWDTVAMSGRGLV